MVHGMFLPKKFFITSGKSQDDGSELNAFDLALADAGIAQCNLVTVSSILPSDAGEIKQVGITPGAITYVVLAKMHGRCGDSIGAGVGYGWGQRDGRRYHGMIAEYRSHNSKEHVEEKLREQLKRMAGSRALDLVEDEVKIITESMKVEEDHGCVLAALVFVPWDVKTGSRKKI